ncbi:MAG TPA: choice-of-anchor Q domain-containing protein [Kofleriaceae bacterium]|nr:choice-of-anchor Q domain-containing protein [Kofleriaceae bacterium]
MGARILIVLVALAATGCEKESKLYCGKHPTDVENCGYLDAGIDARPMCASDPDCDSSPVGPYCEPDTHYCVECYLPEHCAANPDKKFCDLDTFSCRSCVEHADCASNACLPDGTCGNDSTVAYVDPAAPATNTTCTLAEKCSTVAAALLTKRPYVKMQGAISEAVPALAGTVVTFLADPGTTLARPTSGVVFDINNGSDVAIYDLAITGNGDKGVLVDKSTARLVRTSITGCNKKDNRAIEAKMSSTLIVSRATVVANVGGGIFTDATSTYNITNSFLVRNGADDSAVGGASLGATSSGLNRFEMNTIIDNRVSATANAGGLYCATSLPAPNNLIVRNYANGLLGVINANKPGIGGCNLDDSVIGSESDLASFAFVMPDGSGPWDYHIGPGSMAIDRGVTSDIALDVDGDARPFNGKFDVGADEYSP